MLGTAASKKEKLNCANCMNFAVIQCSLKCYTGSQCVHIKQTCAFGHMWTAWAGDNLCLFLFSMDGVGEGLVIFL